MLFESGLIHGKFCPGNIDSACARYNATREKEATFHDAVRRRFRNLDPGSNIIWENYCRVN